LRKSFPATELAAAAGSAPVRQEPVRGGGYGTNTARWRVELEDGRRAFVKLALDEVAAGWLRDEHRVYSQVAAPFLAEFLGWHDGPGRTLLVIEDLADAHWPPPWSRGQVDHVLATLDVLHRMEPPRGLPRLEERRGRLDGWADVAADPAPLLSTGLCSSAWLEEALPALREAAGACELDGESFLHFDVRSDNLCFRGGRAILVDWNLACVGNPLIDVVAWLPSLHLEGGPAPWELVPETGGLSGLLAGFFASRAGLPAPTTAPTVRDFQRRQAAIALPWAARELELPPSAPSGNG
jgi:hypothetical protein